MTETPRRPRLLLLDATRGLAAVAVMLYHAGIVFDAPLGFQRGYLFVDYFFLLSGFVLTLACEEAMRSPVQVGRRAGRFLFARLRRFWPLTATGAILGAAVMALDPAQGPGAAVLLLWIVMALLFVPRLSEPGALYPLNGPQWSLLHELLANALHALLLARCSSRALAGLVALSGVALVWTIAHLGYDLAGSDVLVVNRHPDGGGPAVSLPWWSGFARVGFAYPLGILIARRWQNRPWSFDGRSWIAALAAPVLLIVLLGQLAMPWSWGDAATALMLFPLAFVWAAGSRAPERLSRGLAWLGSLSFPLYAVHLPVLKLVRQSGGGSTAALAACAIALISAVALVWLAAWQGARRRSAHNLPLTVTGASAAS